MGLRASDLELAAMRVQFDELCVRWQIDASCVRQLLEDDRWADQGERAMRILLELDRVMRSLLGEDGVLTWLYDREPHSLSPLQFLVQGHDERRAMLAAARVRHRQIIGADA